MYVLYAGKREGKPAEISLKNEFFGSDGNVVLKAKIIFADEERDDIIGEYLALTNRNLYIRAAIGYNNVMITDIKC